ncbi:MAG: CopG family transcriptional regulator [Candidatus Rokuibacteriota bacterium]|nr:MAG: CopG family transcriptional regulator [Candidatus Rokubacteria bacterium]
MVRTQIQLPVEQHRRLQRWARRLGISMSEAVRRCIAEHLAHDERAPSPEERRRAALAVCGRYRDPSGSARTAVEHDRHLAEAYRR